REYVTGETINTSLEILRKSGLSGQWEDCRDYADVVNLAERLQIATPKSDVRGCSGNAARCALELAVLDAYGRHFQRPVSSIVPLLTPALYEPRERVRYSGAITSARGLKLRLTALAFRVYRFRQIKVKVGIEGYDDPKRLWQARRLLGSKVDIR